MGENEKLARLSEREKTISTFFRDGKLLQIPAKESKRRHVFTEILKDFELEREYAEHEVNNQIQQHHEDFCTIRRWYIDFGFMTRSNGMYRRTALPIDNDK
ncbi:MAG: DUF2087 domain-containing protein [bacterium]|nr:DUF2087 domain-containing protein [bacterium]